MDKLLSALLSADMPIVFVVLLGIIGLLIYLLLNKNKHVENENKQAIEALHVIIDEQRYEMEKLSKVVYQFKEELKKSENEKYELQNEILTLRQENLRLKDLVSKMEEVIQEYKAEIDQLKKERNA